MRTESLNFGGSTDGIRRKRGGGAASGGDFVDTRTVLCETLGPNSALRKGVGVLLSPIPMCINMNMNI